MLLKELRIMCRLSDTNAVKGLMQVNINFISHDKYYNEYYRSSYYLGSGEVDWICNRDRIRTDSLFESLNPIDGKISGAGNFSVTLIISYK